MVQVVMHGVEQMYVIFGIVFVIVTVGMIIITIVIIIFWSHEYLFVLSFIFLFLLPSRNTFRFL